MFKIVQRYKDSRLDLAGGSRLASRQKLHTCQACQKLKRQPVGALQDKKYRLDVQLPRGWNSRLSQATSPSHQPALFWKTWLFTFHSHPSINTPYTHEMLRASKENFERETLKKKKKQDWFIHNLHIKTLQIPLLSSSPLLNPWEVHYQNIFSPYPYLWEGYLVLWEAIKKGPISYW